LAAAHEIVVQVSDTPWWTIAASAGSALIGAVIGSLLTIWAAGKRARDARSLERLRRSQDAARTVDAALFPLSREVETAIANAHSPSLWKAANDFAATAGPALTAIDDSDLAERVKNHRALARIVGGGLGPPPQTSMPSEKVVSAFRLHQDAVHEALEAHVKENKLPSYSAPPRTSVAELEAWRDQQTR
jgi:hypothetical protein